MSKESLHGLFLFCAARGRSPGRRFAQEILKKNYFFFKKPPKIS